METIDSDIQNKIVKESLPNATATLVLGILSIVACMCYGLPGFVLGIVALAISGKSVRLYKENPEKWLDYGNLKAGRITAIIGLSLSAVALLIMIIYIAIVGGIAALSFNEIMNEFNY